MVDNKDNENGNNNNDNNDEAMRDNEYDKTEDNYQDSIHYINDYNNTNVDENINKDKHNNNNYSKNDDYDIQQYKKNEKEIEPKHNEERYLINRHRELLNSHDSRNHEDEEEVYESSPLIQPSPSSSHDSIHREDDNDQHRRRHTPEVFFSNTVYTNPPPLALPAQAIPSNTPNEYFDEDINQDIQKNHSYLEQSLSIFDSSSEREKQSHANSSSILDIFNNKEKTEDDDLSLSHRSVDLKQSNHKNEGIPDKSSISDNDSPTNRGSYNLQDKSSDIEEDESRLLSGKGAKRSFFNVLVLGLGFCIIFSAFSTTQNLMTTVHEDWGYVSLALVYTFFSICNFISPSVVFSLGPRLSVVIAGVPYAFFVIASITGELGVLLFSSVLLGVGAAILWNGQGEYLFRCSHGIQKRLGTLSGVFFSIYQFNQIVGNIIAAFLLSAGISQTILFIVLFVVCLVGIGLLIILRFEPRIVLEQERRTETFYTASKKDRFKQQLKKLKSDIIRTASFFKDIKALLLTPFVLFSGYSQSFFYGRMTAIVGLDWVGWVMSSYGAAECIGSIVLGRISDIMGRRIASNITFALHAAGIVMSIFIESFKPLSLFLPAIIFGFGDAGSNTQTYAVFASLWPHKSTEAFAVIKFAQAIATAIGLGAGAFLSTTVLLITLGVLLLITAVTFWILDFFIRPVDPPGIRRFSFLTRKSRSTDDSRKKYETTQHNSKASDRDHNKRSPKLNNIQNTNNKSDIKNVDVNEQIEMKENSMN